MIIVRPVRTSQVLSGTRDCGSLLVELPLLRPVTPIHNYGVLSKEAAIVNGTLTSIMSARVVAAVL